MNILICYASKTGNAKKCSFKLKEQILGDVTLCNIEEQELNPKDFDIIILGASVRMGRIHNNMSRYIMKYKSTLLSKPLFIFITNSIVSQSQKILSNNIPMKILKHAAYANSFGGELDINKQKGFDKFIVKIATYSIRKNKDAIAPSIIEDNIKDCAIKINEIKIGARLDKLA